MTDRIQFQEQRSLIDGKFVRKVAKLETAYYQNWQKGQQHWFVAKRDVATRKPLVAFNIRAGNSAFTRRAVRATPNDNWVRTNLPLSPKQLFDLLHGGIWEHYSIKFDQINKTLPVPPQGSTADGFEPARKGYYRDEQGKVQACRIGDKHYNKTDAQGNVIEFRHQKAQTFISNLQGQGIELDGEEEDTDTEGVTLS